ncbi:SDR family NAD(P)-dependent oxidoreductase, partial [uncultured Corynebacterium sp.]|uniref:SDR family NAD(P)-dependent oxidoreductase n=1 Tax=uncultured Corynebacterium sp. TaxID=159447 RepID=UPI0025CD9665
MNHKSGSDTPLVDAINAQNAVIDNLTYAPDWTISTARPRPSGSVRQRIFFVPPSQRELRDELAEALTDEAVWWVDSEQELPSGISHLIFVSRSSWVGGIADSDLTALLRLIRRIESRDDVTLDIITGQAVSCPLFSCADHPLDGVHIGLGQTLSNERPEWRVRTLCLRILSPSELLRVLDLDLPETPGHPICIDGSRVATVKMKPISLGEYPKNSAFRRGGTYVILGGTSGIGSMLAEYVARSYEAHIVIVGRRPSAHTESLIRRLRAAGASEVDRHEADLSDEQALRRVFDAYPRIHGVIHSALVLDDATFATMSEANLLDVLRPKVHGSRTLIDALRGRQVDFCLFFSSVQSYLANAGQGNYTGACVAQDSFADLMGAALALNVRVINWGFWGTVGVVAKPKYRERMSELGIGSIEPLEGVAVVERLLAGDERQVTVVKASNVALHRMQIDGKKNDSTGTQESRSNQPDDILSIVVPPFDPDSPEISRHRALSRELEAYARSALECVDLPASVSGRHTRLLAALQATPRPTGRVHRDELLKAMPELTGHLNLLDRCVEKLPAVLRSEIDPLEVLFPSGSFELVESVYRNNPIADYFNKVSARVVAAYQRSMRGQNLDIIEVGGGTGSTTAYILNDLVPKNVSYTFTDISHAFLHRARNAFSQYPFVQYDICDVSSIEKKLVGKFDIVVATNVIHATRDVPETLLNIRSMLRDGGILVLNEITARQDYATLTFGLTDGWWLADDSYRIEHSPLLSSEQWVQLLDKAGFGNVKVHGTPEQQVLVAVNGKGSSSSSVVSASSSDSEEEVLARVEGYLREVVASTMRFSLDEVEPDRPFRDMGIDSLIAMELLKPLREWLGYVPATVLFEFPTVRRLAEHLVEAYSDEVGDGLPQSGLSDESVSAVGSSSSSVVSASSSDSEEE